MPDSSVAIRKPEIHSVLLSTDITEEVINEAVQGGHDLLISHHPLTLQGLKICVRTAM